MSSDHAARPHPPSSRRSAEARARGHLPRAPLAGLVFALLSLLAGSCALAPRVWALSLRLAREPLELAARGHGTAAQARATQLLNELSFTCAPALVAIVGSVALGSFVVQGPSFVGSSQARGSSFPPTSLSRTASALWCLGVLSIVLLALSRWASLELSTLGAEASAWATQLTVLSLAALLVDVAFARARFHASLFLTRREYHDEQRAALGPPEARAARGRALRSFFRERAEARRAATRAGT
jgi:hypothetical protein